MAEMRTIGRDEVLPAGERTEQLAAEVGLARMTSNEVNV
jgi:hypothetical protein